jgi:glycosyltransferase involved in cell wall biosynthesis
MPTPLVSVIMPVYNAERYLDEAVASVLGQTYGELELIMVDDASTDGSLAAARRWQERDPRVRVFANGENLGVARTRNIAMSHARGSYVAPLDNDDAAHPERLALQVAFLEAHPDHGLVGSDIEIMDEGSRTTGYRAYPRDDAAIRRSLLRQNPIANPASMFRMALFRELGGAYDEGHCPVEDYEFVVRAATRTRIANLPRRLTRYRVRGDQAKSRFLKRTLRETIRIQLKGKALGLPDSLTNRVFRLGLRLLLPLPDRAVLGLFKMIHYRKGAGATAAPGEA